MSAPVHQVEISFGDCDPAGIVFYPHYFRFMDATFHKLLHAKTGETHDALCRRLGAKGIGAKGIGLVHAELDFRAPAGNGMTLSCTVTAMTWRDKTVELHYRLACADVLIAEGKEIRALFVMEGARMRAAPLAELKAVLG